MNKRGFTLAEIMIVLTIVGILAAILMPVAFHATPDENVMRFKKGHNTLATVVRELVNSNKYYADGDLGLKPDKTRVTEEDYFCHTFADVISAKEVNCPKTGPSSIGHWDEIDDYGMGNGDLDLICLHTTSNKSFEYKIKTSNNITYYEADNTRFPFGENRRNPVIEGNPINDYYCATLTNKGRGEVGGCDKDGFYHVYKIFCMDIDDYNSGEDPFGYGIRVDGKIVNGPRANEWLQKSVQNKD